MTVEDAWSELVASLEQAGRRLAAASHDPVDSADAHRALLRALNNHLGRFEVDRERPELVAFNGWREKLFMDNPDFRYWVADIRDDRRYRVTGTMGDAAYLSITTYAGRALSARATGRIDADELEVDADGRFAVTVSRERPASGSWVPLEEGSNALWVRFFHQDASAERLGTCTIEPLDAPADPPTLDPEDLARRVRRLAQAVAVLPDVVEASVAADLERPNELRHWSEMAGGAAYTEPGIHYVRGSWLLEPGEALLIEGPVVPARYWNVLLYSRYLNSLDHRSRPVSRTSGTATIRDGRYRFAVAAEDPGSGVDWLDTEGRRFGLVVLRWLQPAGDVPLPEVRQVTVDELRGTP